MAFSKHRIRLVLLNNKTFWPYIILKIRLKIESQKFLLFDLLFYDSLFGKYFTMITITPEIKINPNDLRFSFIRASGPGGQNVNKVATSVQLKFDVLNSEDLSNEVKTKLIKIAGKKISQKGILIIEAKRYRSQEKNRIDAINRLISLIKKAAITEKPRKKTKPTKASNERRIETKKKRSSIKEKRKKII